RCASSPPRCRKTRCDSDRTGMSSCAAVFRLVNRCRPRSDHAPLVERRRRLEDLVVGLHPCLQLVTQTYDRQLAEQWLTMLPSVEGVVAKRADGRYSAGRQHAWIKVKRQRTVDCVVIGIAGDNDSPRLALGLRHGDQE